MLRPMPPESESGKNHPLAIRMGIVAFLNQTITVGSTWGSFSVLLHTNEVRFGVDRELSSLAVPALMLSLACLAPVVGLLASKYPMRRVTVAGAVCSVAGFLLLAMSDSYPLYLLAFGLLLGPGMAVGVVMPSTLVARWFNVNRGKALGLVNIPVVFTVMPLTATWALHAYGLHGTYLMLAALGMVTLIANLFISDPPKAAAAVAVARAGAMAGSHGAGTDVSLRGVLQSRRFWVLAIGANASVVGSIILTAHMVPMAMSWGSTATAAATLLSVFSLVAMVGTIFFGWLADRL